MCEFLITINSPYTATLFIDGVQHPLENNKCIVNIDNENEHSLEIIISKEINKNRFLINLSKAFKFKERKKDEFCDLLYKTNFKLDSAHRSAKADFEYKKGIFLGHSGKRVDIPYISTKLKKVEFYNPKKTIFLSRVDLFSYIFRHRWLESIIYAFLLSLNIYHIIDSLLTYKDDFFVPLEYYFRFAQTPFDEIVISSITLLILITFVLCGNFRFFKKLRSMDRYSEKRE